MRRPLKPFVVEVKRAGRGSPGPAKDIWGTPDGPSAAPDRVRQDADRAFATAAIGSADRMERAETKGRVLVAEGYRSPLELRLEEDEQKRADRRRTPRTKSPEHNTSPVADKLELAEVPDVVRRTGTIHDAVGFSTKLESTKTADGPKRNASELPRHLRWMKRLRHRQ
ncbi:hypothetical protein WDZ92_40975 [Nostoc sp. NIES-2111]